MSELSPAPKSNRLPWILAGVLGCLVICLLIALAGGVFYFMSQSQTTVAVKPTVPPVVVQPTIPPVQPTATRIPPTVPPVASSSSASSQSSAVATPVPSATTQPSPVPPTPTKPPASLTGKIAFSKCDGICDTDDKRTIWVMNADGTGAKKILDRASHPAFSPDGTKIIYYHWRDGLFIANSDGTNAKKLVGDTFTGGDYGSPDWSHDGKYIAFSSQPGGSGNIVVDRAVPNPDAINRQNITVGEAPSYSPDDTQIVFHTCRGPCGIYKSSSNPGSEAVAVVTDDGGLPAWSPDGKRIVYQKDIDGQKQLFIINSDGSGKKQLTSGAVLHVSANWSLDGNFIFYRSPEGGSWGIWVMNADGSNPRKLIDNVPPVNWPYERLAVSK